MKIILTIVFLLFSTAAFAQVPPATLTWQDNSGNDPKVNDQETGFEIQRNLNGGAFTQVGPTTGPNVTTAIDTTRVATVGIDNTYCYRVRAVNTAGASPFSNVACAPAIPALPIPQTIPAPATNLVIK